MCVCVCVCVCVCSQLMRWNMYVGRLVSEGSAHIAKDCFQLANRYSHLWQPSVQHVCVCVCVCMCVCTYTRRHNYVFRWWVSGSRWLYTVILHPWCATARGDVGAQQSMLVIDAQPGSLNPPQTRNRLSYLQLILVIPVMRQWFSITS